MFLGSWDQISFDAVLKHISIGIVWAWSIYINKVLIKVTLNKVIVIYTVTSAQSITWPCSDESRSAVVVLIRQRTRRFACVIFDLRLLSRVERPKKAGLTATTNSRWNRLILASLSVCTCRSVCARMIAYRCQSICASLALRVQTFITAQNNSFVLLSWQRTPMTWLAASAARDVRVFTISECLNLRHTTT